MGDHILHMEHIGVFMMQVEKIDLVAQHGAVKAAFLHQHIVEGVRISIDRGGAHAARGALAANDQALDAKPTQMRD